MCAAPAAVRSPLHLLRLSVVALLAAAAASLVIFTWRWPLLWDAQVFHYGNFLIAHGFAPYRQVLDMNMPGAYLVDAWAIRVFGPGDLAWRIFDFAIMAAAVLAMTTIARTYDWLAGLFAGVLFFILHVIGGPVDAGQRDVIMTVLILIGCACLFEGRRRRSAWWLIPFGLCLGIAGSIKPTVAPLGMLLMALAVWDAGKKGELIAGYLWSGLLGAAAAAAIVLRFFLHYHVFNAFLDLSRTLTPFYAGLDRLPFHLMLRFSMPIAVWTLLPFALAVAPANRLWKSWEQQAILLGIAFGAFSYFLQGKGYSYHRYTLVAFTLLWIAIELAAAMRKAGWPARVAAAGAAVAIAAVPFNTYFAISAQPVNLYAPALESDLRSLGADRLQHGHGGLQHQVQCLDLIDGCYNALYRLRIVQSTGWMGDLLLFAPQQSPVVERYRDLFLSTIRQNPPAVIVLSNEWFNQPPSFDKLEQWPAFEQYLKQHYSVVVEREFAAEAHHGYRIYLRNDVPGSSTGIYP